MLLATSLSNELLIQWGNDTAKGTHILPTAFSSINYTLISAGFVLYSIGALWYENKTLSSFETYWVTRESYTSGYLAIGS